MLYITLFNKKIISISSINNNTSSMISHPKIQTFSQQKKKLTINRSKSKFSNTTLKIPNIYDSKAKQSNFRLLMVKDNDISESYSKTELKQWTEGQKQNNIRKNSFSMGRKQQEKSQKSQKFNNSRTLTLPKKRQNRLSQILNLPHLDKGTFSKQQKLLIVENKKNISNNRKVSFSHYSSKSNNFMGKKTQDETNSTDNVNQKKFILKNFPKNKKTTFIQLSSKYQGDQFEAIHSKSINENSVTQDDVYINTCQDRLSLQRKTISVSVNPKEFVKKVDVEVQAIQEEKQFFSYLRYKRKQEELEDQLKSQFSELEMIKQDRKLYGQRVAQLLSYQNLGPSDLREERIFNLRNQILKFQKKVESIITDKYRVFEDFIVEFQKLEEKLASDSDRFLATFMEQQRLFKQALDNKEEESFQLMLEKMQRTISGYLSETKQKIKLQVKKGKHQKEEANVLLETFDEYKKSIAEHRGLMKNCFGHIKKIPELCYGLWGNQLPNLNVNESFKNKNNEFQMPRCMDCFNSEWKWHMIVQKNILMEPIFKVSSELLK